MDKVKSGERLNIKASDWNALADVVNGQSQRTGGTGTIKSNRSTANTIDVANASDTVIPMYGIVEIVRDAMATSPHPNSQQYQHPIWRANKPVQNNEGIATYGIAQESIAPGVVGKVCIAGVTPVVVAINTYVLEHDISTYYVAPTYVVSQPFSCYMTQEQTPIRVFGSVINNSWQRVLFCYIEPFTDNTPIPAIVGNTVAALTSANIYDVYLYANGYNNPYTGTAYMYLAETSYGRNIPNGTRLMVYRHLVDTTVGSYDDGGGDT